MCENMSHDITVCNYLRCQRKVIADDLAQNMIEDMEQKIQLLEKYRRILRKFNKKEEKLYEINGMTINSNICWVRMRGEISSSSEAVMNFGLQSECCVLISQIKEIGESVGKKLQKHIIIPEVINFQQYGSENNILQWDVFRIRMSELFYSKYVFEQVYCVNQGYFLHRKCVVTDFEFEVDLIL